MATIHLGDQRPTSRGAMLIALCGLCAFLVQYAHKTIYSSRNTNRLTVPSVHWDFCLINTKGTCAVNICSKLFQGQPTDAHQPCKMAINTVLCYILICCLAYFVRICRLCMWYDLAVQACRGSEFDGGVDVTDAEVSSRAKTVLYRLPKEADFLYAYSTAPGTDIVARISHHYRLYSHLLLVLWDKPPPFAVNQIIFYSQKTTEKFVAQPKRYFAISRRRKIQLEPVLRNHLYCAVCALPSCLACLNFSLFHMWKSDKGNKYNKNKWKIKQKSEVEIQRNKLVLKIDVYFIQAVLFADRTNL